MYVHYNCCGVHICLIFSRFADLVLATGSKWSGPVAFPESDTDIRQFVSDWQQRFKSAEDIVIVGGGSVGAGT